MITIKTIFKKIRFGFLYLVYLLLVILVLDYCFYFVYAKKNYKRLSWGQPPPKMAKDISKSTISKLGWISRPDLRKISHFTKFKPKKAAGVIRVGCFGDSYTEGAEVGKRSDYPSLLGKIFRDNGYKNVEVINFGTGSYGFHQTFMMW